MKVILICGKAESGKDTAAGFMESWCKANGKRVMVTHYADLLRYICAKYLGWDGKKDEAGRKLLQTVGTDIFRKEYPDIWVDHIAAVLKCLGHNWDFVIIPDCRFPNEVTRLKDQGFDVTTARIIREGVTNNGRISDRQRTHSSETSMDEWDADTEIYNNDGISELESAVCEAMRTISDVTDQ